MKTPEVRTRRSSNVSSLCTIGSVNMNRRAYGKNGCIQKGETKVFSLRSDRTSEARANLPFHMCKAKKNKRRKNESLICLQPAFILYTLCNSDTTPRA